MKYMLCWKIRPGHYKEAVEKFLETGAPPPSGLESLGRWHQPGSQIGWQLLQGDPTALAQLAVIWGSMLEFEITPVVEDDKAAEAASAVYGK